MGSYTVLCHGGAKVQESPTSVPALPKALWPGAVLLLRSEKMVLNCQAFGIVVLDKEA